MPTTETATPDVNADAVRKLYAEFEEMHLSESSSNDVVQMLDDWFVEQGFRTVIYRPRRRPRRREA